MADVKYYDVILKPVITEKSMAGMGDKKYTFLVHPEATKSQIKEAVEMCIRDSAWTAAGNFMPLCAEESVRAAEAGI